MAQFYLLHLLENINPACLALIDITREIAIAWGKC